MTLFRIAAFWTVLILVLCLIPSDSIPTASFPLSADKWVHAALFAMFGFLWLRVQPRRGWMIFGVGVAFGIGIELLQGAMPLGRAMDPFDALADTVGLAIGLGLAAWWGNDSVGAVSR